MMKSFFSAVFSPVCCLVSFSLFFFLSPLPLVLVSPPPHFFVSPFFPQLCFVYIQPSPSFSARLPPHLPFLAAGALPALDINQMDLLVMLDKWRNIFLELLINRLCRILDKSMLMNVFLLPSCLSLDPSASMWFCLSVFLPVERHVRCVPQGKHFLRCILCIHPAFACIQWEETGWLVIIKHSHVNSLCLTYSSLKCHRTREPNCPKTIATR